MDTTTAPIKRYLISETAEQCGSNEEHAYACICGATFEVHIVWTDEDGDTCEDVFNVHAAAGVFDEFECPVTGDTVDAATIAMEFAV